MQLSPRLPEGYSATAERMVARSTTEHQRLARATAAIAVSASGQVRSACPSKMTNLSPLGNAKFLPGELRQRHALALQLTDQPRTLDLIGGELTAEASACNRLTCAQAAGFQSWLPIFLG